MEVVRSFCGISEGPRSALPSMRCCPETYAFPSDRTDTSDYADASLIQLPSKQRKSRAQNGDPLLQRLSREERRRRRRCTEKYRNAHATRERARIEAFNHGFGELRKLLHIYPPDKKLSKIEILRSAIAYIAFLKHILNT